MGTSNRVSRPLTRKAKFHYAILVADRSEAGRRPASSLLANQIGHDRPNSSSATRCATRIA